MTMTNDRSKKEFTQIITEYNKKRDSAIIAAVRDGNIEPIKHLAENADTPLPNDYVIEISAHKMCLAIKSIPKDLKEKSRQWLKEHGYSEYGG